MFVSVTMYGEVFVSKVKKRKTASLELYEVRLHFKVGRIFPHEASKTVSRICTDQLLQVRDSQQKKKLKMSQRRI